MSRLNNLRQRVRQDGVLSLPGWALRWLYWNTGLSGPRRAPTPVAAQAAHTPPPICEDLRAWCAAHPDATYQAVLPAQHIRREPPHTVEPELHPIFERYYDVEAPEQALVSVAGASLATHGLVFLPDGSLAGEVVTHLHEFRPLILASEPAYTKPWPATVRHQAGTYYSLIIGDHRNYYHWQHDVVMRLLAVLPLLPADTRFIVPPQLTAFQRAMLGVLGLEPSRLVEFPPDEVWVCERLFFCTPCLKPVIDVPDYLQAWAARCRAVFELEPKQPNKRIFMSRRLDNHWRPHNEPEVITLLEAYGFEVHLTARLSFREQVELFSEAEMIIGTGAGLANMIYAPAGLKVLQIMEPSYPGGVYLPLARALDHDLWYMFGESVPNPESRYGRADIRIPLDKLRLSVEGMLAPASPPALASAGHA